MTLHSQESRPCGALSKALAITAAVCVISTAAGADSEAEHLSWQNGLSQTTIFSIVQDERGYVWCATEDGLNRFDGESFQAYRNDPSDPTSLPGNIVRDLHLDSAGDVWLATEGGGVGRWSASTDAFERFRHDSADPANSLSNNYARALLRDSEGLVWIAMRGAGLDRLDPATGAITHFRKDSLLDLPGNKGNNGKGKNNGGDGSLGTNDVYALLEASDGTLWVGADDGLYSFDRAGQSFTYVHLRKNKKETRVRSLFEDAAGTLWVGSKEEGLFRHETATGETTRFKHDNNDRYSLADNFVQRILGDSYGNLWIGTPRGLDLYQPQDQSFRHFQPEDEKAVGSGAITSLFEDLSGQLWVGTELGGVSLWKDPGADFDNYDDSTFGTYQVDVVTSFTEDLRGNLFVGTVGAGMVLMNRGDGTETRYVNDPSDPMSLNDDRVMALHRDQRGRIWVGTQRGGLSRFIRRKGQFKAFTHKPNNKNSLSSNGVMTIHEDSAGTLWVGTFGGGLNAYPGKGGTFVAFRHDPANPLSLGSDRVTAILEANNGQLWIGTDGGGLNLFNPLTGTAQRFVNDPSNPRSLPSDTVCALYRDAAGTLWVGTRGGGLARMDSQPTILTEPSFSTFSERDGLPNSVVYAVQPDPAGNLWLSTNKGLSRFDPMTLTFLNFDVQDGLQANEFNFGASFRSTSGELFFGGINGFNSLTPEGAVQAPLSGQPSVASGLAVQASRGSRAQRATVALASLGGR